MNVVIVSLANGSDHQRYTTVIANKICLKHNVMVVCTPFFNKTGLCKQIKVNNSIKSPKTRIDNSLLNLGLWWEIFSDIKSMNPTFIHFISAHPANLLIVMLFFYVNFIFSIHDVKPHPDEAVSKFVEIYNYIVKVVANKIVVHSKLGKLQLGKYQYKATVLPLCGMDGKHSSSEKGFVLFFGRIKPYKGLDLFIRAVEYALQECPDIQVVIAGDGDISPYTPLIVSNNNFTILNNYISEQETDRLFRNCRFVVLPYYSATQSGVVPLAYSYGKPVIATKVGAIPEMVNDGVGKLVEPNVEQIGDAIKLLWSNSMVYEQFCQKVNIEYINHYSTENMESKFELFYENISKK